jgi:hypothetical protein
VKPTILRLITPAAGAVLMLIGAALLLFRPGGQPAALGWAAYAPLSRAVFVPSLVPYVPAAIALVLIGFCAIAAWVGFEIGRARRDVAQDGPASAP